MGRFSRQLLCRLPDWHNSSDWLCSERGPTRKKCSCAYNCTLERKGFPYDPHPLTHRQGHSSLSGLTQNGKALPATWQRDAQSRLEPGETVLATFEPDLDQRLFFARGLVLLTDRRVLAADEDGRTEEAARADRGKAEGGPLRWQEWPLASDLTLKAQEYGGAGVLELVGPEGRLGHWRYTAGRGPEAQ